MDAATQELLTLLQGKARDADCLGRIRIFVPGARKALVEAGDRPTLGELHALLVDWAQGADAELGAQGLALAADLAEHGLGDFELAIAAYDRALDLAPDAELTRRLADTYAHRGGEGDRQEAADLYAAVGEVLGEDGGVEALEAALLQRPAHEGALGALEALLAEDPRRLLPHWERYLEAAGASAGAGAVTRRRLALARAYDAEERYRDAMLCIAPLVDHRDAEALVLRDVLLAKLESESEQAMPTFEPTLGLRPRSGDTMVGFKLPAADVGEAVARAKAAVAQRSVQSAPPDPLAPARPLSPRPPANPLAIPGASVDPRAHTAPSLPHASPFPPRASAEAIAPTAASLPHAPAPVPPPPVVAAAFADSDTGAFTTQASPRKRKRWIIAGAVAAAAAVTGIVLATRGGSPPPPNLPPAAEAAPAVPAPAPRVEAPPAPAPAPAPTTPPAAPAAQAAPPSAQEPKLPPSAGTAPAGKVEGVMSLLRVRGGKLTRGQLAAAMAKMQDALDACYARALGRNPKLSGRTVLEWTVGPGGRVAGVRKARDTARDAQLYQCTSGAIQGVRFASPKGGKSRVRLPLDYKLD